MNAKRLGLGIVVAAVVSFFAVVKAPLDASHANSSKLVPPKCTAADTLNERAVVRNGFSVSCGPASAVVYARGRWQVIKPGSCTRGGGGRLYFGVTYSGKGRTAPHKSLGLIMGSSPKAGVNDVIDGEIEIVPGGPHAALSGTAYPHLDPGGVLKGGTFDVYGRNGAGPTGTRLLGAYSCR